METLVTTGQVHVAGEVTTAAKAAFADITDTVRNRILEIGYDDSAKGFDGATCGVNIAIGKQSPDIAQGVDTAHETRVEAATDPLDAQGAGDQGLMFGYAISDTPELMPLPIALAHRLSRRLTEVRKSGALDYLRPDGKTQVTVAYDGATPVRLDTVVLSTQHADGVDLDNTLAPDIRDQVVNTVLAELGHSTLDTSDYRLLINPTGKFVLGGPMGDAGLTGRKIIVDTYGGWARHGGERSPARTRRRWIAPRPTRCAGWPKRRRRRIGRAHRGAGRLRHRQGRAGRVVRRDVRHRDRRPGQDREGHRRGVRPAPGAIIRDLDLLRPIYAQTAAYGHFGRTDVDLPWEQTNKVDDLKRAI